MMKPHSFKSISLSIFSVVLIGMLYISCSPTKQVIREPIKTLGEDYLLHKMDSSEFRFKDFSTKFSATYKSSDKDLSFSGQLRIKKDSIIWISISPAMGIEMYRVILTPDSVKILDRLKSTYSLASNAYINTLFDTKIDFLMLQSFLIGNDFSHYEKNLFKASLFNGHYKLETTERRKLRKYAKTNNEDAVFIQELLLNILTFKIEEISLKENKINADNRKLQAFYTNFQLVSGQLFPISCRLEISDKELSKIGIDINYTNMQVDANPEYSFKIPSKYKEVKSAQ